MSLEWRALSENPKETTSLPIPDLIYQLLVSRGLKSEKDIQNFLKATLNDMQSPFSIFNMKKVVDRLYFSYQNKEKILIYGDFDLDGTSATALMVDGLRALGFSNISYRQPKRLSDGYGLHAAFIKDFKNEGIDLIISVDVGITANEAAIEAKKLGIDLIITDHHQPKKDLPEAFAILNPNLEECKSGLAYLCGAGIAYYLLLAVKIHWNEKAISHSFSAKDVLEYFTIGTLTDMVPMRNENRALAKHGIIQIQNTEKVGIRVLLETLGYWGRPISCRDIAIGIAPKLNALSRMEEGLLPIDILLEKNEEQARAKMKKVLALNDKRKSLQKDAEDEAEREFLSRGRQGFAFVYSKNFHKGIIGLVATKLSQKYNIPSFVGSLTEEGEIVGSARAPNVEGFSLLDVYEKTKEDLITFGGHHFASGFKLNANKAEAWFKSLQNYFSDKDPLSRGFTYDLEASLKDLNAETMQWLDRLQPYGTGFEVPVFCLKSIYIDSVKALRGGHLRLQVKEGTSKLTALYFSPPIEKADLSSGSKVDALVELQWNYYNGRKSLQLLIKDIRQSND